MGIHRKSGTKENTNLDWGKNLDGVAGQEIKIFYKKNKKEVVQNLDLLDLELCNVFFAKKEKNAKSQITAGT